MSQIVLSKYKLQFIFKEAKKYGLCVFPLKSVEITLLKVLQHFFQSGLLSADGVLYFHLQSMGHLFCLCVQLLLLSMGNVGADQGQDAHIN